MYRSATLLNREFAWLDSNGHELEHWGEPGNIFWSGYSPGNQTAVLARIAPGGTTTSLWLLDPQRKTMTRLTPDSDAGQSGLIAADGNSVFLGAGTGYKGSITHKWLNGSGKEEKLPELGAFSNMISISRDGRYVFATRQDPQTNFDIFYMDLNGPPNFIPILTSSYSEFDVRLSPNNKWLAYVSDETGTAELYVTSFPARAAKYRVSNNGITLMDVFASFDWSPDGKSLRYKLGDTIYTVDVHENGDRLDFSSVKELFTLPHDAMSIVIMPDGKRTLIAKTVGNQRSAPLELVLNWRHLVQ